MTYQEIFKRLLTDIKVDLHEQFIRNFERKAFFDRAWKPAQRNSRGSLLLRSGALRSSIRAAVDTSAIRWTSSLPYANAHNQGARIKVTKKMKGYFWYQYRLAAGSLQYNKRKELKRTSTNLKLSAEALFYRAMALKPIGSTIVIPKRQFIGEHPEVDRSVKEISKSWMESDLKNFIQEKLKNLIK